MHSEINSLLQWLIATIKHYLFKGLRILTGSVLNVFWSEKSKQTE